MAAPVRIRDLTLIRVVTYSKMMSFCARVYMTSRQPVAKKEASHFGVATAGE
jgi:hypothetical protein